MITEKQIEICQALVDTRLIDSAYHSVELVEGKEGVKFPAYKIGDEQYYIGPEDKRKMFAYIRQSGPSIASDRRQESSSGKLYRMMAPHRIVIFQDRFKGDKDSLITRFLRVGFMQDVNLISFNNNSFQLGKQESPIGDFAFDATTFYLAIDIQIHFWLFPSQCDAELCNTFPNPIKCLP